QVLHAVQPARRDPHGGAAGTWAPGTAGERVGRRAAQLARELYEGAGRSPLHPLSSCGDAMTIQPDALGRRPCECPGCSWREGECVVLVVRLHDTDEQPFLCTPCREDRGLVPA